MYLTRYVVNPARRGTRRLLASQQRVHAAVLSGFPPGLPTGRVLWRLDQSGHRTELFIASAAKPDLTHLVEETGWPTSSTWETADYQPFLDRLEAGQRWAFRLTANPVRRTTPTGPGSRGQVKAHVTPAQQEGWLLSKAARLGFAVPDGLTGVPQVVVKDRRTARFSRRSDGASREVTVAMATFEGLLEVTDADSLRRSLTEGVGRAKAYGCGLLTLAKA